MIPGVQSKYARLYEVSVCNNLEYEDEREESKLIIAESDEHATIKAVKFMFETFGDDCDEEGTYSPVPSFEIKEIKEVDGYKVTLIKNTNLKEND